jgi:transposase-like protein
VFLSINGERHYLWRAVDLDGNVLNILAQRCGNKAATKELFHKLLKGCQHVPRVIVTDKLKSYGVAKREGLPSVEHRQRERWMQRFKFPEYTQRFLAVYGPIAQHFRRDGFGFPFRIPSRNAAKGPGLAGNSEPPHHRIRVVTEVVTPRSVRCSC